MNNQEKFKQTFNEIHAPEALLGKVMDLQMEKKEFKTRNLVKAAVCALTVTLGMFGAGNGICYAATGETLITKMKVVINGEETQQDVEWTQTKEGYHGEITIPSNDGSSVTVLTVSDDIPENVNVSMDIHKEEVPGENGIVEEETVEIEIHDEGNIESVAYEKVEVVSDNSSETAEEPNSSGDMDVTE